MKEFIALVLSLALLCGFAALAEADVGTKMDCRIEEGLPDRRGQLLHPD